MDLDQKRKCTALGARTGDRRGAALPAAIFGLVILSVLGAAIYSMGNVQRRATMNRESSVRAMLVTEEGIAHAVAVVRDSLRAMSYTRLLRGSDNNPSANGDNGRIIGYTLSAGLQVPIAGRTTTEGTYTIAMRDDVGDPDGDPLVDGNHRIIMRCTGTTPDGSSAMIDVVFGAVPMPAMAVDGSAIISGSPQVIGGCGGVHANNNLMLSGHVTTTGTVTASGTVSGSGDAMQPDGTTVTPLSNRERIEIPTLNPLEFCVNADYDLRADGTVLVRATGTVFPAIASAYNGWKRSSSSPVVWDGSGAITTGTYCIYGNAKVSGNPGTSAAPLALTMFVNGSIEISGNPFLRPDQDDISIVASGDVSISGNPSAANENYEGSIYAGAQCKTSGNPRIAGQVICKDGAQPAGAIEYIATTEVSGNPEITYSCGSTLTRRKILEWIQVSN